MKKVTLTYNKRNDSIGHKKKKKPIRPEIEFSFKDVIINCLGDTGSETSVISRDVFYKIL